MKNEATKPSPGKAVIFRRSVSLAKVELLPCGTAGDMCCGHREYAPGRKDDPLFDMVAFRSDVRDIMRGVGSIRPLIAAIDSNSLKPTLRRGDRGEDVKIIQTNLELPVDGKFGPATEAKLRQFQRDRNLVPDGIVGPKTWSLMKLP